MVSRISILLFIVLTVFLGTWALLHPGFFRVHDFVHAARIAEMHAALDSGHVPPRWSANFGYGYGMPLFNFYAPLPYIVGAILFEFLPILTVLKLLLVIATMGTAIGMYKFARENVGIGAALLAALAATVAPYRAVNIFVRGAFSEIWGMAWIPWMFLGISRIARARGGLLFLAITTAGMSLSHNLVTVMASCVGFTWGASLILEDLWWNRISFRQSVERVLRMVLGFALGFCLAAWYVLPSVLEKRFTQLEATILTGYFDFRLHFLYIRQLLNSAWGYGGSQWGPDDGISFFLGYGQILAVCVSIALLVQAVISKSKKLSFLFSQKHFRMASTLVLLGCTVGLTLTHALPVWEYVPFFKFFQFPWRWLSVSTVLLALLVGQTVDLIHTKTIKYVLSGLFLVLLCLPTQWFQPESWLDTADALYYTDKERIRSHMSEILPDYIPAAVEVADLAEWQSFAENSVGTNITEHVLDRPHEHLLFVNQAKMQSVVFPIAYFPGWRGEVDGKQVHIEPNEAGLISMSIPEGKHAVGLFFTESPIRVFANLISLITAAGLVSYWLYFRDRRART